MRRPIVTSPSITRTAVENYLADLDDDTFFAVIADARSRPPNETRRCATPGRKPITKENAQ